MLTRLAKADGGNPNAEKADMKRQQARTKSTFSLKSLKENLVEQSKKTSVDESVASPSTSKTPDTATTNFDF